MNPFINRMIRAAKLDVNLYEEVEADESAMGQAMGVVILSSLAAGVGNYFITGLGGLIWATISALVGWFIWAYMVYFIGVKFLPEPQTSSSHGELLRTIGFSSSPGIIRVLGVIPFLNWILNLAASIWMLVAMIIAVRQALDYKSTVRAVVVCIIGWLIYMIVVWLLLSLVGKF
ncbi:YIP1 family protein [Calditrichota bacterium]